MFEYDRLAFDVAQQVAQFRSNATAIGSPKPTSPPFLNGYSSAVPFDMCREAEFGRTSVGGTETFGWISTSKPSNLDNDENSPREVAQQDGFSLDEIAQFAQLLCPPKKSPPSEYQCHICYRTGHYIWNCPNRFNNSYEELTPYQGRKKCYGEFQCQQCKRKWTSQNSVANEAQCCIKCHIPVFPHKQLSMDKAVTLGLVKAPRVAPAKLAPIGHGRPLFNANRQRL